MSSYTKLPAARVWDIATSRLAKVPKEGNRAVFQTYLTERKAGRNVDASTLTSDADEFRRFGVFLGQRCTRQAGREAIVAYFADLSNLEPGTRYKSFVILRGFFRWLTN